MAPIIGKEYSSSKIFPILQDLVKDENPEVRLNVVSGLFKLAEVLGSEILNQAFLTTLNNMTKDT